MRQGSAKQLHRGGKWDSRGIVVDVGREGPIDPAALFGRKRPVEVEVGSGKGTFVLARAAARPEVNLLGIEYAGSYCHYTADRVRRAGLSNVRMLHADAGEVFARLPAASLARVHIYFPDPWPKRRHHRRRLLQARFLPRLLHTLAPGGELMIVTDHVGYFQQIRRILTDVPGLARIPFPRMTDAGGQIVGTNFERKYIAQGRAFYSLARFRYA